MKKVIVLIVLICTIFGLSGCFTSSFNPLGSEEYVIFEDVDKTVRLEIPFSVSHGIGRLYILKEDKMISFVVDYFIPREMIIVYISVPGLEDSTFYLGVSFKQVNWLKLDYDIMYLKERIQSFGNQEHEIFTGLDVELHRVYDEQVNPLNYIYNLWESVDNKLLFVNDDLHYYYGYIVKGTWDEDDVWISFLDESFTIWSRNDLSMKLSGTFSFDGLDIILEPFEWYVHIPRVVILRFAKLNDG